MMMDTGHAGSCFNYSIKILCLHGPWCLVTVPADSNPLPLAGATDMFFLSLGWVDDSAISVSYPH